MIVVHRLNGKEFVVNCEMIRSVEATPDTLLTMADGEKMMIKESVTQIIESTIEYKRMIFFNRVEAK